MKRWTIVAAYALALGLAGAPLTVQATMHGDEEAADATGEAAEAATEGAAEEAPADTDGEAGDAAASEEEGSAEMHEGSH